MGNDSLNNPELMKLAFLNVYAQPCASVDTCVLRGCAFRINLAQREIWPLPSAPGRDLQTLGMSCLITVSAYLETLGHSR